MTNLYHIFNQKPALEEEDMFIELEQLTRLFVKSGLFRIDANEKTNFARIAFPQASAHLMISKRELTDPELLPRTRQKLDFLLRKSYGVSSPARINNTIKKLIADINKYHEVDEDMEMKLARILIQATHPVVMLLIILEKVEVFLSYSYNIADVLDIVTWQVAGDNSGMQSTSGKETAVFVSAGGDPLNFELTESEKEIVALDEDRVYGDGLPAIARIMVIAGQELGHFSDIMRDKSGRKISRHSADMGGNMAKHNVKIGRLRDIENVESIFHMLKVTTLGNLIEFERRMKYFRKNKVRSLLTMYTWLKMHYLRRRFISKAIKLNFIPIPRFLEHKYLGHDVFDMIKDMRFNLAPEADVYQDKNPLVEEAIACIEALARIPQQVNKWGRQITKYFMPNLYYVYYQEVIPARIQDYERMTGNTFTFYPGKLHKLSWLTIRRKRIARFFRERWRALFRRK